MTQTHEFFAALSDPKRIRMLELLAAGEPRRVSDLVAEFDITRQSLTRHLDVLCDAGILNTEWRGRERYTVLAEGALDPVRQWLDRHDKFWSSRLADLKAMVEEERE
jgi:DNA-binding transcriptional ArsR family regulator